jgi:hypothetical protein
VEACVASMKDWLRWIGDGVRKELMAGKEPGAR